MSSSDSNPENASSAPAGEDNRISHTTEMGPPASSAAATATANIWGWFEKAQEQAKVVKELATVKAQAIVQQANEIRQNYDMQIASDILMHSMGAGATVVNRHQEGGAAPTSKKSGEEVTTEESLDVHYITENILTMSFPYSAKTKPKGMKQWNDINKVAEFLREKHAGRYMIWNVSEDPYDYSLFDNQVLEYKFPGHPAPPLGLLFKICAAIESWLDADRNNVAVVHCLTGKGRTGSILACVLAWIGEFSSPLEALNYVANRRKLSIEELTIPSQRRYIQYFSNVLDGVKPRSDPLLLRRVIMNTIPRFGAAKDGSVEGCCPYLQIFKNGNLLANSYIPSKASVKSTGSDGNKQPIELKWISTNEGSISFHMDVMIHGDVLIRCRNMDLNNGHRESMFRAAFHTGYTPVGVLRLTKAQLDGCDVDDRFDDGFFVDFIFAPVEKRDLSGRNVPLSAPPEMPIETELPSAARPVDTLQDATDSGLVVDSDVASKFDEMLHRDGRFWDKIALRKSRATANDSKKRKSRKFATSNNEVFSIGDDSFDTGRAPNANDKFAELYDDSSLLMDVKAEISINSAAVSSAAPPSNSSEISDLELIMQLAQAEEEENISLTPPEPLSQAHNSIESNIISKVDSPNIAASANPSSAISDELMALEDFERELGLVSPLKTEHSAGNGSTSAPTSNDDINFGDNFDELEKYLQSLGNS